MTDNFFEELDKGFGDQSEPITEPEDQIRVLRLMSRFFNDQLEALESPNLSVYLSDPELNINLRETMELTDQYTKRLLEGIERPNTELSPEEIDIGNTTNPEEPIRDPLVRWAGIEALRAYIRYLLEFIAEGEFSKQVSGPDSAEFIRRLRNTFLSLGILVIRLYEGLEAEHER